MSRAQSFSKLHNVGQLLSHTAELDPSGIAVVECRGRDGAGKFRYRQTSFAELDRDSDRIAAGLVEMGMQPGDRVCLMVPPGIDFISLVFAAFKAQAVAVLIDPGMGKENLIECLAAVEPRGFITIFKGHVARCLYRKRFPQADLNVSVGGFFPWCRSLSRLRRCEQPLKANYDAREPAAIIFTTGSTGPPKGVLYKHSNFLNQAREIVEYFGIEPGGVDISAFPLFALFNIATGCTTVFPDMDFTRPAEIHPPNLIDAASDWQANQSFGSPALWNTVGNWCERHEARIPTLRTVLSAGAPVPARTLQRVKSLAAENSVMYTPYGATEALPVACADSEMLLSSEITSSGGTRGTCVGHRFPLIEWKVIEIADGPLESIELTRELPRGQIGELMVTGPVVTEEYVTRTDQNALHKVRDGDRVWHRMGDAGYLDDQERFWFCGRKNHRVICGDEVLFTVPCEAVFNQHPKVYRSALIGIGPPGRKVPHIVIEPQPGESELSAAHSDQLREELLEIAAANPLTQLIAHVHIQSKLPTDIRHNSKIFREVLTADYEQRLTGSST